MGWTDWVMNLYKKDIVNYFLSWYRGPPRYPIILVPGLMGSQLHAKAKTDKDGPTRRSIWITRDIVDDTEHWVDKIKLEYDPDEHVTRDAPGMKIAPPPLGDTLSVEWLAPDIPRPTATSEVSRDQGQGEDETDGLVHGLIDKAPYAHIWLTDHLKMLNPKAWFNKLESLAYFEDMVKALLKKGYVRARDLRAAPYDFRKAPNELTDYYDELKMMIEETYTQNGNTPVLIVAHSMGNPVMLHFYNHYPHISQQWKDKYVRAHVALAPAWAGAVKSAIAICSGYGYGMLVKQTEIRKVIRSLPGVSFLLPFPSVFGEEYVLVRTPNKEYRLQDLEDLFNDLGHTQGYALWTESKDITTAPLQFPGVDVHCLYGLNVATPGCLVYKDQEDFPDKTPTLEVDDGDGTVNKRSLEAFKTWMVKEGEEEKNGDGGDRVKSLVLDQVDHAGVLKDPRVFEYIYQLIPKKES